VAGENLVSIATSGWGPVWIVLIMAVVTLITRWGGVYIMGFVPIGERTRNFIAAMSGSVLVALLAPMALEGDGGARLALLTTALVMFAVKKPLVASTAGILVAALYRQL
jgi:uncharacterized membrane protein